jgi:CRISPR/Cas system CSM-associated protein Csm3 (group 7 of RAMP superfamily)
MQLRIELTIASRTAFSIGAGGSMMTIADKSIIRDGWGRPIIPGSQLKGRLRWSVEQVLRGLGQDIPGPFDGPNREEMNTLVKQLFGTPKLRSPLFFADLPGVIGDPAQMDALRTERIQQQSLIRPSVTINRAHRTAADKLLMFQETALETTRFHSPRAITGQITDVSHAALLWMAAHLSTRWGGTKSRGLGWATVEARVFLDQQERSATQLRADLQALVQQLGGHA